MSARRGARTAACGFLLVLALGGCALQPPRAPEPIPARCTDHIDGRIAVHADSTPDAQRNDLYGNFSLELMGGDAGSLELRSPLGQTVARARWWRDGAEVDDARRARYFDSFGAMSLATLGIELPRAALQDWVRGRPAADLPFRRLDGGFAQLGWEVRVQWRDGRVHVLRASRAASASAQGAQVSLVFDHTAQSGPDCAPAP